MDGKKEVAGWLLGIENFRSDCFVREADMLFHLIYPSCEERPVLDLLYHGAIETQVVTAFNTWTICPKEVWEAKTTILPHAFEFLTFF